MQARLHFHHQLLREDGVIFISIDDNEVHYLRLLCDEIFGAQNFVGTIAWQKKYAVSNDHKGISPMHDFIVVYSKSSGFNRNLLPRTAKNDKQYRFEDEQGIFRIDNYTCNKTADERENLNYPIVNPNTEEEIWPKRTSVWRYSEERHRQNIAKDLVWWGKDGLSSVPAYKRYRKDLRGGGGVVPSTWWTHEDAGHNDEARKEIREFELEKDFPTPKPTRLIERILQIATNPGDIILDSFAGSGTTGHAVLKMNAADPTLAPRRFISVELEQEIARPITRERLKRAIDGYGKHEKLGGGFRFCFLGETLLDAEGNLNSNASWRDLAHFLYLQKFGSPPDAALFDQSTGFIGKGAGASLFLLFKDGAVAPLDTGAFRRLDDFGGPKIVYCDCICVPPPLLERAQIAAFQTPYEVTR